VSSCFNGDGHARQLRSLVGAIAAALAATLAMHASDAAYAQSVAEVDSAESYVTGPAMDRTTLGTTPLRLGHRTESFGQEASETAIGGRGAIDLAGAVGFVDGQFRISNESRFGSNVGGGIRWYSDDYLTGAQRILGISGWYDGQETILNNYFNQGGVSFESLGEFIDFRVNANIPFEDEKTGDQTFISGELNFIGNSLAQATIVPTDVALRVVDAEAAVRVYDLNAWVYGGGYQMDGNGVSDAGAKVGARGYVTNDLALDLGVTNDDVFGTNTVFQIVWMPGRTGAGPTSWIHTLADRMREPVYRNAYIATQQVETQGSIALTDADGQEISIVHVDFTNAGGGDGTFENPYTSLESVNNAGSEQGDIILVHAQNGANVYDGQEVTLKDEQRLLGEGGGIEHEVVTQQLGTVVIPETFDGALNATRPTLQNAVGAAVTLAGITNESENFAQMEVSNFVITGGDNAVISGANGVASVDINNLNITGTTGDGIALAAMTQTLENGTTRSRFAVTIDEIIFDNVGNDDADDDIQLDAGTAQTTISHSTAISNIVSTNGDGNGINLIEMQRAVTINNYDWDGGTTGLGALLITDAAAQGGVTLSNSDAGDDNLLTGGTVGAAYAINIQNSAGTHTVTGTLVDDMGGDSIVVNDGNSNLNFTGRITQTANNASILSVTGGHEGSLTFTELTANQGVIQATTGDGLQFNNADGNYTFNDTVEFTGTSSAINVVNGSDAVIVMQDGQFTNTTGDTITFAGGDGNLTFNGKILQNQNVAVLSVTGGHNGTLIFNDLAADPGVISATNGSGLQFNNADGAYTFNDRVDLLAGGDAGIDVLAGSEGTFTFADGNIVNPNVGPAVNIDASSAIFTYSGNIDSNNSDAVVLNANTGGSVTFNSTIDSTEGIQVTANTGGTFLFAGQVTLTGTGNGVEILNNTGGSTSFSNIDITKTGAGTGFVATSASPGHTVTVTGNDNNISTETGVALNLNMIAAGAAGINFESVSSDGAASGIIISNVTGGPVNIGVGGAAGAGGTIANSTGVGVDAAIVITDSTNVNLNGLIVSGTAGTDDGIQVSHTNAVASTVSITNTSIAGGLEGVDYNRTASGTSRITLTGNTVGTTAGDAVNMDIGGSGTANVTVANNLQLDGGTNQALAFNTSGGSAKTVNLLVDSNTMNNNSAADATAGFTANGAGTLNATVTDNVMTNASTARAFAMTTNSGTTRLNLNANTGINAGVTPEFLLEQVGGTFQVQDLLTVDARNNGDVQQVGTITNDAGPIPTP
jgi:hypothetical protein